MKHMRNPTVQNMEAESAAYKRWDFVSGLEENFLKQKSKMHWLEVGDKNNKVFHRGATTREIVNSIKEIQRSEGVVLTSPEDIKIEAERHFRELYNTNRAIMLVFQWRSFKISYHTDAQTWKRRV